MDSLMVLQLILQEMMDWLVVDVIVEILVLSMAYRDRIRRVRRLAHCPLNLMRRSEYELGLF